MFLMKRKSLLFMIFQHDSRVLKGEKGPNLFPKPVYDEPPFEQRRKMYEIHDIEFAKNMTKVQTEAMDYPRYKALCRGEELRPMAYVAKLKCYLSSRNDPYFRLQPAKVEVLHLDPGLYLFHDVISKAEMRQIREAAGPLVCYYNCCLFHTSNIFANE